MTRESASLGWNPIISVLCKQIFIFGLLFVPIPLILWLSDNYDYISLYVTFLAIASPVLIAMLIIYVFFLLQAIRGYFYYYRHAKNAIKHSCIHPDWIIRSDLCIGIVIVDEVERIIYINGTICRLDDIQDIKWKHRLLLHPECWLDVYTKHGKEPFERIGVDGVKETKKFQADLFQAINSAVQR